MSTAFPNGVDPALIIDALFRFGNPNVAQFDQQIRAIQAYLSKPARVVVPDQNLALSATQWAPLCLILSGTLTAGRTVTCPTSLGVAQERFVVNTTGQNITLSPASGGTTVVLSSNTSSVVIYDGSNFFISGSSVASTTFGEDLETVDATHQKVVGFNGVALDTAAPGTSGQVYRYDSGTGKFYAARLTLDDVDAALAVTLSGGSGGVFQCGATWTLTGLTASPACNAAGVTAATLTEIINSVAGTSKNVLGVANTISGANLPHTTYTRSTAGDVVDLQLALTKNGVGPKTSSLGSVRGTFQDRYFTGQDTASDATAATASGANATLTGGAGSATITGVLVAGGMAVGTHFSVPASGTPKYTYVWCAHTSVAATWHDNTNNAVFPMTRITSNATFSNSDTVSHGFDLYRTDSLLTAAFDVSRAT